MYRVLGSTLCIKPVISRCREHLVSSDNGQTWTNRDQDVVGGGYTQRKGQKTVAAEEQCLYRCCYKYLTYIVIY